MQLRQLISAFAATGIVSIYACSHRELRGKVDASKDGKTYLVIEDDGNGGCRPLRVDGKIWIHPLHAPGPVTPGTHAISCDDDEQPRLSFAVREGTTFHFDYWGP